MTEPRWLFAVQVGFGDKRASHRNHFIVRHAHECPSLHLSITGNSESSFSTPHFLQTLIRTPRGQATMFQGMQPYLVSSQITIGSYGFVNTGYRIVREGRIDH
jgi:hypothetical protein